ncbi:MAG: hypothetical protein FWE82_09610, partial [Defluviitaleaceae bacterium]|nr:hypothetical protein [Defluviitaleaceae bacterium]
MGKILIETFAATSCDGSHGTVPGLAKSLSEELGIEMEFAPHLIWEMENDENLPEYMLEHFKRIQSGEADANGFFIDGEWFETRPHNANDAVKIRGRFFEAAGKTDPANMNLVGRKMDAIKTDGSVIDVLHFANSVVENEMGSFSTDFKKIWFFEGSIGELIINACPIEKLTYRGYEINKLIETAEKHPEIFASKDTGENNGGGKIEIKKADINEIDAVLVPFEELRDKFHPCVIVGYSKEGGHKMHRAISEKYGGVGYKAIRRTDSWTCGWMGVVAKDMLRRDAGYAPPGDVADDKVLCLTCFMGGGNYDAQFERIGIT